MRQYNSSQETNTIID